MTAWKTEKLSNLLAVSIGGIWGEEAGLAEIDVSVVRVTELKAHGRIDPRSAVTRSVTLKQLASRELQEGDLLLEKSGGGPNSPVGRVGYFFQEGTRTVCSNFMQLMRPDSTKVLPKYLFYFLDAFHSNGGTIPMQTATTNIRNIKTPRYMDIDVPVPSIDEQHKIVELLEDQLSRLDAALSDVKQAKTKAAQFRRSYIHEMTTAIEGSEVMGILDICDVYQPKTISTKELIPDGEFPVYGANGQIGFYDKFNHEESEVTVTCRGATCGTVNVIPAMSWITGNAMVFRPKDSRIQKGFLEYVLRGMDWTPVITGTAQPQITRTSIQEVFVNVPSPDIQNDIHMKLESSLTQVKNAALLSEKVEMQAASLRRSLLQAAFTGQLTNEVASV